MSVEWSKSCVHRRDFCRLCLYLVLTFPDSQSIKSKKDLLHHWRSDGSGVFPELRKQVANVEISDTVIALFKGPECPTRRFSATIYRNDYRVKAY